MGSFALPDIQSHQIFGLQHSYIALDPAQPLQRNASPKGRRIETSTVMIHLLMMMSLIRENSNKCFLQGGRRRN